MVWSQLSPRSPARSKDPKARMGSCASPNTKRSVVTKSGLTCGDRKSGRMTVNGNDIDHELRAGTPEQFRIVGVDNTENGKTKFGLVALVLPKDENGK